MTTQLDLFEGVKLPEPKTEIQLGKHSVQFPLQKKRREALNKLMDILKELEGKDIFVGSYEAGGRHFLFDTLKLPRMRLDFYPAQIKANLNYIPSVIVLWGSRNAQVRIYSDYLVAVREQEYMGYWHWLLDFRNGFYDNTLDQFKSHYACLTITKFKD